MKKTQWARVRYSKLEDQEENETLKKIRAIFGKKSLSKSLRFILPWGHSLKSIESIYGGGFVSLFEFVRWLFLFNLVTAILVIVFIMLPQLVFDLNDTDIFIKNITLSNEFCSNFLDKENDTSVSWTFSDPIITDNKNFKESASIIRDLLFTSVTSKSKTESTEINYPNDNVSMVYTTSPQVTLEPVGFDNELIITKCCTSTYKDLLQNSTNGYDWLDTFLDYLQGTGSVENSFLFYGFYSNKSIKSSTKLTNGSMEHNYYMGMAFALITLLNLILSAVTMIFRLGKNTRKKIVEKIDSVKSMDLCNKVICSWDYRVKVKKEDGSFFINYTKSAYLRAIKCELEDMDYEKRLKNQKFKDKLWLFTKRLFVNVVIVGLFFLGGFVFFKLNELALNAKRNTKQRFVSLILEYVPGIQLKVINILFRQVFQRINVLEEFKRSTTITLLLLRTGTARIAVLIFLILTMTSNILKIENKCASQKNVILQEFNPTDLAINQKNNIWCWESYVGQEFYKLVVIDFVLQFVFLLYELISKLLNKYFQIEFFNLPFDLEAKFLDLLFIQTVFWLSLYFSPFIGVFGPVFYFVKFYTNLISLKKLTSFSKETMIGSKLHSSFFLILFAVFLLIVILFGMVFTLVRPSSSCGPFSLQYVINQSGTEFSVFSEILNQFRFSFPVDLLVVIEFIFSNVFLFFIGLLMTLLIWFFFNYAASYKLMAKELRVIINEEQSKNERLLKKLKREKNILRNDASNKTTADQEDKIDLDTTFKRLESIEPNYLEIGEV